ncbi:MAG: DUF2508 family protein [Lachnospiraceae bacterium]|nr:DUF2508 family protein [Lachnospiraceae bacterium]
MNILSKLTTNTSKPNSTYHHEKEILLSELDTTVKSLEAAHCRFEYITEPDLIDCTIFELNAIQLKYKFLLNKMKELEKAI